MRVFIVISLCLLGFAGFGQSRHDIVTRKIMSIRMTFSHNNVVIKNYYSRSGDDSLQFYNGKLQYVFKPTAAQDGKVMQLKRFDTRGREQEAQIYTYHHDSTYSIEITEPNKGASINKTYYAANHRVLYSIDRNRDTTQFYYSPSGKLIKITKKVKGNEKVDFLADPQGNDTEWFARFITVPNMEMSYSYKRESGLMTEVTTESSAKKLTVYYTYEFYE